MYETDPRIVLTLDAGGTNLIFSAIAGNREIVEPVHFHSVPDDLDRMFGIPVFINNDGNLFAYGEAISGALPEVNALLERSGSTKRYRNLLGVTLGTGFGAGAVIDGRLLTGDNGCGGDVWVFRNKHHAGMICEESVSIRAVRRVYGEITGSDAAHLTPRDIFDIAEGTRPGDREAARESFRRFGEVAGDVISQALTIIDGIVVLGGGLTGAAKYFMPSLLAEMRGEIGTFAGDRFPRLQMQTYDLDSPEEAAEFVREKSVPVAVPHSEERVRYHHIRQTPVVRSKLGASRAIALGAYAFAIAELDRRQ